MGTSGTPLISGQELARLRSMPGDMLVEAAAVHPVIDELVMQRRINEGPKLPRDAAALRRAVETLSAENAELRRALGVYRHLTVPAPVVAE